MSEDISNLVLDPYYSDGLPDGITCMGWGCCVHCNGGKNNCARGSYYCGKNTCWKIVYKGQITAVSENETCTIKFDDKCYRIIENIPFTEIKHFSVEKENGVYNVGDVVLSKIDGCTKIATQFCSRNNKYKWTVCEFCSNRGLYALNENMSCIGYRYDLETNKKL